MDRYTQNDLRKMYEAPPQELTEKIHAAIVFLPVREQEDKSMKKKLSFSAVVAIALVIVLMATALAAATNDTINDLVYRVWPDLALTLKPVNLSCTDQGIKVEVVSAVAGDNEIVITYTVQDLLGDRLGTGGAAFGDINTDIFETPDPSMKEVEGEGEGFTHFSAEEGKIIGAAKMVWNTNGIAEGNYITFSLQSVDPGREILSSFDLRPYLAQAGDQLLTSPLPETLRYVEGHYSYDRRFPNDLRVIDWTNGLEIPLADSVTLSGAGYFGGRLHVQIHNTNSSSPWLYSLDLRNSNPNPVSESGSVSSIRWGGSGSSPEWVETFVPLSQEYLENEDITAVLIKYMPPINGLWEIKIPARMIKVSD